jgi:hypothetical protein
MSSRNHPSIFPCLYSSRSLRNQTRIQLFTYECKTTNNVLILIQLFLDYARTYFTGAMEKYFLSFHKEWENLSGTTESFGWSDPEDWDGQGM